MGHSVQMKKDRNPEFEETPTTINTLSDDCLIHIFLRLTTIADKIKIERVCKRWKKLSKYSWMSFKKFDFHVDTWGIRNEFLLINDRIIDQVVVKLVRVYLTSVSLTLDAFKKICKLCPNIKEIHLYDHLRLNDRKASRNSDFHKFRSFVATPSRYSRCACTNEDWQEIIALLMSKCKNLQKFSLELSHDFYNQNNLAKLFADMKNLKSLSLSYCKYMGPNLTFLNDFCYDALKEITLGSLDNSSSDSISSIIKKCKNLKKICLNELKNEGIEAIFEAVSSHAQSLEFLKITQKKWCVLFEGGILLKLTQILESTSRLIHLKHLDVNELMLVVDDEFLKIVNANCKQLEHLNIGGCSRVTEEGISSLSDLPKLRTLVIFFEHLSPPMRENLINLKLEMVHILV